MKRQKNFWATLAFKSRKHFWSHQHDTVYRSMCGLVRHTNHIDEINKPWEKRCRNCTRSINQ